MDGDKGGILMDLKEIGEVLSNFWRNMRNWRGNYLEEKNRQERLREQQYMRAQLEQTGSYLRRFLLEIVRESNRIDPDVFPSKPKLSDIGYVECRKTENSTYYIYKILIRSDAKINKQQLHKMMMNSRTGAINNINGYLQKLVAEKAAIGKQLELLNFRRNCMNQQQQEDFLEATTKANELASNYDEKNCSINFLNSILQYSMHATIKKLEYKPKNSYLDVLLECR